MFPPPVHCNKSLQRCNVRGVWEHEALGHAVLWLIYDHPNEASAQLCQSREQKDLLAHSNEDVRVTANTEKVHQHPRGCQTFPLGLATEGNRSQKQDMWGLVWKCLETSLYETEAGLVSLASPFFTLPLGETADHQTLENCLTWEVVQSLECTNNKPMVSLCSFTAWEGNQATEDSKREAWDWTFEDPIETA